MNMSHFTQSEKPISQPNRVKQVIKLSNGSLAVQLHSGQTFQITQEDEMFQTFIIYTVLEGL